MYLGCQVHVCSQSDPKIRFIENRNQWPCDIDFGVRVSGGAMFVSAGEFNYYFLDQEKLEKLHDNTHNQHAESSFIREKEMVDGRMIRVRFHGSNKNAQPVPKEKLDAYYNYFLGKDEHTWASNAGSYKSLYYSSLYDCIDLNLYSSGDFIKYDFVVSPGADPSAIAWEYEGAEEVSIEDGVVKARSPQVSILENRPEAYQIIAGQKVAVKCEYRLLNNRLSFDFPEGYDSCYELIIDPLLIFSTYSGSTADNWGSSATPGEHGKLYSTGTTNEYPNTSLQGKFPATPGAFQTTYGGIFDVAILKYDSLGRNLLYASYLGGQFSESPHSLVINKNNELLVLGTTSSLDFPTSTSAFSRTFSGGAEEQNVIVYENGSDIFVSKISSNGTQLLASTYLGGSANDGLNPTLNETATNYSILTANYGDQLRGDIISDDNGNIFVSTVTSSSNFPVTAGYDMTYNGGQTDALILKLTPDLSTITWGTFLGGSLADASHTIKIDKNGNLFVGGGTASIDFPVTTGTYQQTHAGSADGWIGKVSPDGSSLLSSTFTGTPNFNQIYFLDLNSNDEVYAYGQTRGGFPVTNGVYHNVNGGQFIQKFSSDLKTLYFSTVFGSGRGIPDISPTAFLVNDCNNIYVSGWGGILNTGEGFWPGSSTHGMPLTPDAYQRTTSGSDFYFMVLTADASEFLYGTYLGGTLSRTHVDGGTSRFDKKGVVYHAVCSGCQGFNATGNPTSDFPTTPGAWSRTNNSQNCNNAAFKFDLTSLKARIQTNSVNLKNPGLSSVCFPDKIVFQNLSIGGKTFEWKFGDGVTLIRTDTAAITYQYAAQGQYVVKLKAFNSGTCIGSDSTSTVVNVYKAQGQAGPDLTICKGTSAHLTASNGVVYDWKDVSGKSISSEASPLVSPVDTTEYRVAITDVHGCVKKDTVNVRVVPGIDFKFEVATVNNCVTRPAVKVVNLMEDDDKDKDAISFDFGDGVTSDKPQDVHEYKQDGNYTVRVVGKKDFCIYDEKVLVPIHTLFIPNVITPGGTPGYNDTFRIKYGEQFISNAGVKASLLVYDRWGVLVYESSDYKENWVGETLTSGVYYYEIEMEDHTTCKSWVQIIK